MASLDRHDQLLDLLAERESLSVEQAAEIFGISPITVRRDFRHLAERGLARRVRGGIRRLRHGREGQMMPFAMREVRLADEKDAICRRAADLIETDQVVMVDGGTTTYFLSRHLPDHPMSLITNSLRLASAIEEHRPGRLGLEMYITGGYVFPQSGLLVGPNTQASLGQYHAHWALISVGGISPEGIFNTNELVVDSERQMIEHAERVAVLADHSKIGRHAMCHVGGLDLVDLVITDRHPDAAAGVAALRALEVEVIEVELEPQPA